MIYRHKGHRGEVTETPSSVIIDCHECSIKIETRTLHGAKSQFDKRHLRVERTINKNV